MEKTVMEKNYDFLKRMRVIHKPNRRDAAATPSAQEIEITNSWQIAVKQNCAEQVLQAAEDFQDYLLRSMNISVPVVRFEKMEKAPNTILFTAKADYAGTLQEVPEGDFAFALEVNDDSIVLCAVSDRAVLYGGVYLEDRMNFRAAPFLTKGFSLRKSLTRMRSLHSGCGIDQFPDWQLNAILHAGFSAIDIFVKAPDTTTAGYLNINDVIERAHKYGLEVVLYSYLNSYKHPDDPDAEEFFDSVYGEIFRRHPGFSSIHLVGESLEFPSKDPATTGKRHRDSIVDGIPDPRVSPGWWPCKDYPAYIKRIADAVHKVKPEAEVILNTYNWGWTEPELREEFLKQLPKDVTVHITYDIFKVNVRNGLKSPVMDYSISADVPGSYFETEAKAAHAAGIKRLRCTTNLAGATWDFGTVPYVPVPFRFAKRMQVLKEYLLNYGLTSFYDAHHYGWWPNPCNDLAKEIFSTDGEQDVEKILQKVAVRDYGQAAAANIMEAWRIWSNSMDYYVGTNEDQYGPWRPGPAYPFIFQPNITRTMSPKEIAFPAAPHAHFGGRIIKTLYQPYENVNQSPGPLRFPGEVRSLEKMLVMWEQGLDLVIKAQELIPEHLKENGTMLWALGKFIRNSIITTTNMKKWWLLNIKLQASYSQEEMLDILDQLEAIANKEVANVKDTFDAVRTDSRIGWEPSMEYVCDEWHLNWKLRQMDSMFVELNTYRGIVKLAAPIE